MSHAPPTSPPAPTPPATPPAKGPIDLLHDRLRWLREQPAARPGDLTEYHAFCPVHDAAVTFEPGAAPEPPARPLRIYADRNGTIERFECDDGCTQCSVLRAIGVGMADLIANPWADELDAAARMGRSRKPGRKTSKADPSPPTAADASRGAYAPIAVRLSDVQPETLAWLWPNRIPLGKLTVLAGDPGLGKTFLTHDIAARVSTGKGWPDGDDDDDGACGGLGGAGDVILLSAEDGLADTIRPRLDAAGADSRRIIALTAVRSVDGYESPFSLARDLRSLELVLESCERPRLVVIDPISAYLSRTDSHNNAEVRALLAPLSKLAERHRVAVVAINHLNKGNGTGGGKAIYRSMGSLAFIAAARAGWLIARSPEDPERRLMLVAKMNVAREPHGLSYGIVDGRIVWDHEPVTVTADEALNGGEGGWNARGEAGDSTGRQTLVTEAVEMLNDMLAGREVPAGDIIDAANAQGLAPMTLRRAKGIVGLRRRRLGFGPESRVMLSRLCDPLPAAYMPSVPSKNAAEDQPALFAAAAAPAPIPAHPDSEHV